MKNGKDMQKKMIKSMCYAVSKTNLDKYFTGLSDSQVLGEGNFGKVFKYTNPTSELFKAGAYKDRHEVAVKVTKEIEYDEVFQELNSSLCLADYEEFWENETSNLGIIDYCFFDAAVKPRQYYLTMTYYPYTLVDFIEGTAPIDNYSYQVKLIMIVLSIQLEKMHQRNLLHRDIKPSNVVMDSKLMPHFIDFGTMSMFLETADSFVGTPTYMSPETTKHQAYGRRSDFFSLGLLFNNLVNRDTSSHFKMLKNANASNHFKTENFSNYSLNVNDLYWPQEYKFLSKLMKNSLDDSKTLKTLINKLESLIMEQHQILQKQKELSPRKMSKEERIRTVRTMAIPRSMKTGLSRTHDFSKIREDSYRNHLQIIV
jgi:serine/threonine protein kinase